MIHERLVLEFPDGGVRDAGTVFCPTCNALVGAPCTQPTDTTRRTVTWFHYSRETYLYNELGRARAAAAAAANAEGV